MRCFVLALKLIVNLWLDVKVMDCWLSAWKVFKLFQPHQLFTLNTNRKSRWWSRAALSAWVLWEGAITPVTRLVSTNLAFSSPRSNLLHSFILNVSFLPTMSLTVRDLSHHQVIPLGLASQSGLRVGDRILEVNSIDLRHATHQEAVRALLANKQEIHMLVRRDPSPPGMQVRPRTATGWVKYAKGSNTLTNCACVVAGSWNPEAARGETWHQHSWRGQGPRRKPLWCHRWRCLHLQGCCTV